MRELKFRAWNTARNCWTSRVELDGGWGRPMFMHGEIENDGGYQTDNTIIEQYTGLKDKNGREIYEGDIIRIEPFFKKKGAKRFKREKPYSNPIAVVEWDEEEAAFDENHYSKGEFDSGGLLFEMTSEWECLEGTRRHDVTVIGNIHENPELLKEEE